MHIFLQELELVQYLEVINFHNHSFPLFRPILLFGLFHRLFYFFLLGIKEIHLLEPQLIFLVKKFLLINTPLPENLFVLSILRHFYHRSY